MTELINKVISISNKKTSIRLAAAEWKALDLICERENIKRCHLIELIDDKRDNHIALTCTIRLFSLIYFYRLLSNQQQAYSPTYHPDSPIFEAIYSIL